jgi:copper chaperone CopZ
MSMRTLAFAVVATLMFSAPARAELLRVEIKTLGMDWETCAHAVRVAMQKVDGVREVKVSLKEGLTVLDLKPANRVTLAKLREVIKNNGFVSKEAVIVASGNVTTNQGVAVFEVSGTGERLPFTGSVAPSGQGLSRLTSPPK